MKKKHIGCLAYSLMCREEPNLNQFNHAHLLAAPLAAMAPLSACLLWGGPFSSCSPKHGAASMLCLELLPGLSEAGRPCAEAAAAQLRWKVSKSSLAFCRNSSCSARASALLSCLCTHKQRNTLPAMHRPTVNVHMGHFLASHVLGGGNTFHAACHKDCH